MAQQLINIGSTPNDGTGDPIRTAMSKANANFTELYEGLENVEVSSIEWENVNNKPAFATVATSGDYTDLSNTPALGTVATLDGYAVPVGGTEGQVLAKASITDGDVEWVDQTGGGGGGSLNNIVEDTTPQLGGNLDLNTFSVGAADAADLTKLSELTATSTELNYVDGVTSAVQTQLDAKVAKADFNANTILAANTDDTPTAVTIDEQRLVGRITSGNITGLTAAEVRTLLNVEDGATADQTGAEMATAINSAGGLELSAINSLDGATAGGLYQQALITALGMVEGESLGPVNAGATEFTPVVFGTGAFVDITVPGAPTTASSTAGAITLDFEDKDVLKTTTTENITSITFSNIAPYTEVIWRVVQTTAYNITFPAGTIMAGNNGLLLYTGLANSRVKFIIYNDNGTYEVDVTNEGVVGA